MMRRTKRTLPYNSAASAQYARNGMNLCYFKCLFV